jgi:hypothetical protein
VQFERRLRVAYLKGWDCMKLQYRGWTIETGKKEFTHCSYSVVKGTGQKQKYLGGTGNIAEAKIMIDRYLDIGIGKPV